MVYTLYFLIYFIFFLIGITFGSFFTLAVYRIPLKQDILYTRSYCPKCNHRLEFLDLIPIFSYLFLRGKCRYCKEPIRIRYLLFELLTGIIFLCVAIRVGLNIFFDLKILINTIFLLLNFARFMYSIWNK